MKLLFAVYFVAHLAIVFASLEDDNNNLIYVNSASFILCNIYYPKCTDLAYENIPHASIVEDKPFKFIIHGYLSSAKADWVQSMKKAYLKKDNYNVVLVDWKIPTISKLCYESKAKQCEDVGEIISQFLIKLNTDHHISFEKFHLIGHSLGAHISGFAGKFIKTEQNGGTLGRITGLDPARPCFENVNSKERLSESDAKFVDVIHTNTGTIGFGYKGVLGHADFYPNGGSTQPGCGLKRGDLAACSHSRAHALFEESINSSKFYSRECSSMSDYEKGKCKNNPSAIMGENVNQHSKGQYYLATNKKEPFAKNDSTK